MFISILAPKSLWKPCSFILCRWDLGRVCCILVLVPFLSANSSVLEILNAFSCNSGNLSQDFVSWLLLWAFLLACDLPDFSSVAPYITLTPIMGCLRKTVWLNFDRSAPSDTASVVSHFPELRYQQVCQLQSGWPPGNHLSLTCPRAPASVLTTRGALDTCSSSLMRKALDKGIDLNSYQASSSNLQWSVLPKTLYSCQANENNEQVCVLV